MISHKVSQNKNSASSAHRIIEANGLAEHGGYGLWIERAMLHLTTYASLPQCLHSKHNKLVPTLPEDLQQARRGSAQMTGLR